MKKIGNLGRYGAEFLVVFIGVWLSLLAEDWRQSRNDQSIELASLERMSEDLSSDISDLRINYDRAQAGVTNGEWLLDGLTVLGLSPEKLNLALSATQLCSYFIHNSSEYLSLQNSGQLDVISDADLRRKIVARYGRRDFIQNMHRGDCDNSHEVFDSMSRYVDTAMPPGEVMAFGSGADGLPDSTRPRVVSVDDPEALVADRQFVNSLTKLLSFRRFALSRIQIEIEETEKLKMDIESRIERLK